MNSTTVNDSSFDNDFYLEASSRYPLLTAAQERRIDLKKWAAARRCIRLLVSEPQGWQLVRDFAEACLTRPPEVDRFEPRSLYFTLRKDIVDLLAGGKHQKLLKTLVDETTVNETSPTAALALIDKMHWPTTLQTGLAIIHLRRQGIPLPDLMADAMCIWQPAWSRRYLPVGSVRPSPPLQNALAHYCAARDQLVMHNLRLVHKLAWDHPGRNIPQRDLVQDGIVGLIRAAEKFEFSRGFRFTTYAYPWINQHLQRATENKGSLITYPAHVVQEINQLHRARMAHLEKTGLEPEVDRLVEETGFDSDKIDQLRRLTNLTVSIDHSDADDNELRFAANIPDPDSEAAVENAERSSIRRLLWQHIDQLDERERAVICGRWGLDGRPQRTFAQLADQLHVSREWVRQLEKTALNKLAQEAQLNRAFEETLA